MRRCSNHLGDMLGPCSSARSSQLLGPDRGLRFPRTTWPKSATPELLYQGLRTEKDSEPSPRDVRRRVRGRSSPTPSHDLWPEPYCFGLAMAFPLCTSLLDSLRMLLQNQRRAERQGTFWANSVCLGSCLVVCLLAYIGPLMSDSGLKGDSRGTYRN